MVFQNFKVSQTFPKIGNVYFWGDNVYVWGNKAYSRGFLKILGFLLLGGGGRFGLSGSGPVEVFEKEAIQTCDLTTGVVFVEWPW